MNVLPVPDCYSVIERVRTRSRPSAGNGAEFAAEIEDQRATVKKIGEVLGIKPAQ